MPQPEEVNDFMTARRPARIDTANLAPAGLGPCKGRLP